jgi:type 1 glutamine amidotransferase
MSSQLSANKILFLAGEPSHGWNAHEFIAGSELLAKCLNDARLGVTASVSEGWPASATALEGLSAVVLYTDGEDRHVAKGHTAKLRELHESGVGVVVLHYTLEGADAEMNAFFMDSIGGFFEVDWSVNPQWTLEKGTLAKHATTNGVEPFSTRDEWYFHMRFREGMKGITPILTAVPDESVLGNDGPRSGNTALREELRSGVPQLLAWTAENGDAGRGFVTTGGNFHYNWANADFRKLTLNGIVWAAGVEVPANGVESEVGPLVVYQTIGEAIARNDLEDIRRHLEADPGLLNKPGRGNLTPLHQAIMRKREDAVELLLEAGADPNIVTPGKESALHLAIDRGLKRSAGLILESGIDFSIRNKGGWTALHLAGAKNRNEIMKMMIEAGADVNLRSELGGSPLHEAAVGGDAELIHMLLEAGCDPKVASKTGVTAYDIAVEYKNTVAAEILKPLTR